MITITFVEYDGSAREVEAESGTTLMRAAVDNGVDSILAECGGAGNCATCHCYVDEQWSAKLFPPSEREKEMLECVVEPQDNSRLSCQIVLSEVMDGLTVDLPESQY